STISTSTSSSSSSSSPSSPVTVCLPSSLSLKHHLLLHLLHLLLLLPFLPVTVCLPSSITAVQLACLTASSQASNRPLVASKQIPCPPITTVLPTKAAFQSPPQGDRVWGQLHR